MSEFKYLLIVLIGTLFMATAVLSDSTVNMTCLAPNILQANSTYIVTVANNITNMVLTKNIPCPYGCINATSQCRSAPDVEIYGIVGSIFGFMGVLVVSVYISDHFFPYVSLVTSLILGILCAALAWSGIYLPSYGTIFWAEAVIYILMVPVLAYRQVMGE
jgi:hypothetical protein